MMSISADPQASNVWSSADVAEVSACLRRFRAAFRDDDEEVRKCVIFWLLREAHDARNMVAFVLESESLRCGGLAGYLQLRADRYADTARKLDAGELPPGEAWR